MRRYGGAHWRWIGTGPYDTDVLVVIGGSTLTATEIFRKDLEKRGYEVPPDPDDFASDDTVFGRFFCFQDLRDCGIWLPKVPEDVQEIGTVAHESVHVVNHILTRCGVEFTVDGPPGMQHVNDEPWAYFTGYLVRSILSFANEVREDLNKRKPKPNKSCPK